MTSKKYRYADGTYVLHIPTSIYHQYAATNINNGARGGRCRRRNSLRFELPTTVVNVRDDNYHGWALRQIRRSICELIVVVDDCGEVDRRFSVIKA